jgi:transposase
MTNPTNQIGIITSVQRRRRWAASEKVRMVEETFEPGMTVGLVARRHGVAPNQLFTWRRLVAQGGRQWQNQVRELHRLLGKKTQEAEILKEALEHATGSKNVWPAPFARGLCKVADPVCVNVSGRWEDPGQDGDPRVPVLINSTASSRHFFDQGSRTPVDCQAISLFPTRKHPRSVRRSDYAVRGTSW